MGFAASAHTTALTALLSSVIALSSATAAVADSGGASLPSDRPYSGPERPKRTAPGSGGHRYIAPDRTRPVLTHLSVSSRSLFALGRPVTITLRISDQSAYVRARIVIVHVASNQRVFSTQLGRVSTRNTHRFRWRGNEGGVRLESGRYRVSIYARDGAGNPLRRSGRVARTTTIEYRTHRFPVAGPYSFGGPDARFGAPRSGHSHAGQDILAAEGTPVVAPRGGTVSWRGYQARGAGHYVVIDAAGENFDYAFMHLRSGSVRVSKEERVATGQQIGEVGQTGGATGPHLHFEIWRGTWYGGGRAIDPLPALRAWARYS